MSTKKYPQPMDPSAREGSGQPVQNHRRSCWAALTLVEEVKNLFPETEVEFGDYDQRNTALSVTFGTDGLGGLRDLLALVSSDRRVREVNLKAGTPYPGDAVKVTFRSSARTQDLRTPFGLGEAWEIMAEAYDQGDSLAEGAQRAEQVRSARTPKTDEAFGSTTADYEGGSL